MHIEVVNGQYRMMPAAKPAPTSEPGNEQSGAEKTSAVKAVTPVERVEDRIEFASAGVRETRSVESREEVERPSVNAQLIAGRVEGSIEFLDAGPSTRNGLLDRAYFVQPEQLSAYNASRIGAQIDVRV